ncbi:DUF2243 domain-containing protein [Adhaeribacter sp. BT258]|uniref:DUF2243 domain-containing protein n=2 Tax=Adhaeribacter terrigena TaxID=2793070 RepID=A0ABS1C652_9BACT|nr:DUF2243 domain-containing protein [Adhaeribacter terrigena]
MLSAFIVLGGLVAFLTYLSAKSHNNRVVANPDINYLDPVPLTTASLVLGIGLGGFIDGIVLHQILQWHEMVSNRMPPVTLTTKSVNMFWDGIFHLFTLMVVFTGIILLWKLLHRENIDRSGKILAGGLLAGWGLFNIIEGIIDHHLLKLHNVKEVTAHPGFWNFGFLGISVLMLLMGYWLVNKKRQIPADISR